MITEQADNVYCSRCMARISEDCDCEFPQTKELHSEDPVEMADRMMYYFSNNTYKPWTKNASYRIMASVYGQVTARDIWREAKKRLVFSTEK